MQRREFLQTTLVTVAGASIPGRIFAAADAAPAATTPATAPAPAAPTAMELATARLYQLGRRNVPMHDPCAIQKCKDEYWIYRSQNQSFRSKDLLNWTNGPAVLSAPFPWFTDAVPGYRGTAFWAPDVLKIGDQYHLFYAISAFGKNTSAIGHATNPTLDPADPEYKWADLGMVVKSVATDDFNCIDPTAIVDQDGNLWLAFGSFWTGIKLIALDKKTGQRIPGSPMTSIASNPLHATATNEGKLEDPINKSQIEAPYLYYHDKFYYLFVNWGLCCHGVASTYNIRIGRSEKITGPYLDKDGKDLAHDGGTLFFGDEGPMLPAAPGRPGVIPPTPPQVHALVGPGQSGIFQEGDKFWFSCHYYDATTNGASDLSIRPLTWDKATGWPILGEYPENSPRPTRPPQGAGRGRRGGGGNQPAPAAATPVPAVSATPAAASTSASP